MRILIAGGPKTGKTTLAEKLAKELKIEKVLHDEDLVGKFEWSEQSEVVAGWITDPGPWIIEGVAVGRALRKWFKTHPEGLPADRIIYLDKPRVELEEAQNRMKKGCLTIWADVEVELKKRGFVAEVMA
jgi:adenylate kinase family enzyme